MSFNTPLLDSALLERLDELQLSARNVVEGATTGRHKSPIKGASVEFRQHRFYTPGDEPRRLDWRLLARTDRPYVREYDEETNLRSVLLLDASGSMGYRGAGMDKFQYGARLVACLSYLMLRQTEGVGLGLFSERLDRWIAPAAGSRQLSRMIDGLERTTTHGASGLADVLSAVADRMERRSLVVLVSDLLVPVDPLAQGVARLLHDRHELIVIQVLDRDEIEFPFSHWTRFQSMESASARLCEPAMARKTYQRNFERHTRALSELCRARGVELHRMSTDEPLLETLPRFLTRRQSGIQSRA